MFDNISKTRYFFIIRFFFFLMNSFKILFGAQLNYRCLSIDGSSSKFWSTLTYLKRHEPNLDIWSTNRFDT